MRLLSINLGLKFTHCVDEAFRLLGFWSLSSRSLVLSAIWCCIQELECLQDHLEDLALACRDVVGNLTELESEVIICQHIQHSLHL